MRRLKYARTMYAISKISPHEKTNILHMRKTKAQISFAVIAKLISVFVFAIRIVQFISFLNTNFLVSSHLLCLYSSVCVGPVREPHYWFSHDAAQIGCHKSKVAIPVETYSALSIQTSSCSEHKTLLIILFHVMIDTRTDCTNIVRVHPTG